jgi:gluconokinase
MDYILGIDVGTGSTKAVAVGTDLKAFESSQVFYPTMSNKPGYSEQNPETIWNAFCTSIEELSMKLDAKPAAISLSTAMHSLIAVDENGRALAPMMTWADSRSIAVADRLLSTGEGMELYKATGTPIHSMSPLCKIIWIRENQPELFSKTYKFISIKEYIWYKLFHSFECDHSIASCTGLMDVYELQWSALALKAAGVDEGKLSKLVSTSYIRKDRVANESLSFLLPATPFVIGASDGCLANLGTGAINPGTAALTIGTSGALRVASREAVFNPHDMTFFYRLDEEIFVNGGPVNNGGIALKWHLKNLYNREELGTADYDLALANAEKIPAGAEGLIFLPYLQGERAPIWDSKSCGTFFGIGLKHRTAHFTRAVVEGICYALNDVLLSLEASGQQIIQLNVSGGFVTSRVWLQILADITGKKLLLVSTEDASAVGAAFLARKALTRSSVYSSPAHAEEKWILPAEDNHLRYQKYFKRYKTLYQNLKALMHEQSDNPI